MSYKLKVLLCGPNGEKSKLVNRFVQSKFNNNYKLTVGVDIFTKDVEVQNEKCTLSIWDIGSSERFSFIRTTFYRGAACAIILFDLKSEKNWEDVQAWYDEIKNHAGEIPIAFVERGNGTDGEETRNKIKKIVESTGNKYYETNSHGKNIDEIFSTLAHETVRMLA